MRLPDPDRSNAVLIGSATYASSELPELPAVSRNLEDLRVILTDPAATGLRPDRCTVIAHPVDPISVYRALRRAAAEAEDMLLVYFAGHGCISPRNELYLGLHGTELDELAFSALPYEQLRYALNGSPAAVRAVILDCCFSGNAIPTMAGNGPTGSGELAIEGTYVLTATPSNTAALAPAGEPHTAFTGELIRLLNTGVPNGSKLLTFAETYRQLLQAAKIRGIPQPRQLGIDTADQLALSQNLAVQDVEDDMDTPEASDLRLAIARGAVGQLHLFHVTADGSLLQRTLQQSRGWGTWSTLNLPTEAYDVAATANGDDGDLDLFVVDREGTLWCRRYIKGRWQPWDETDVDTRLASIRRLAAASVRHGHRDVYAVAENGRCGHRHRSDRGGWERWWVDKREDRWIDVALTSRWGSHLDAALLRDDGDVLCRSWNPARGNWTEWQSLGDPPGEAPVIGLTALSAHPNHHEIFTLDASGQVSHRWQWDDGRWKPWYSMPAPSGAPIVDIAAGAPSRMWQELVAIDEEGTLWQRTYHYGDDVKDWTPWRHIR